MNTEELYAIIEDIQSGEIDADEAFEALWGKTFDDATQEIEQKSFPPYEPPIGDEHASKWRSDRQ